MQCNYSLDAGLLYVVVVAVSCCRHDSRPTASFLFAGCHTRDASAVRAMQSSPGGAQAKKKNGLRRRVYEEVGVRDDFVNLKNVLDQ
jgi:hypothetical protein